MVNADLIGVVIVRMDGDWTVTEQAPWSEQYMNLDGPNGQKSCVSAKLLRESRR